MPDPHCKMPELMRRAAVASFDTAFGAAMSTEDSELLIEIRALREVMERREVSDLLVEFARLTQEWRMKTGVR